MGVFQWHNMFHEDQGDDDITFVAVNLSLLHGIIKDFSPGLQYSSNVSYCSVTACGSQA